MSYQSEIHCKMVIFNPKSHAPETSKGSESASILLVRLFYICQANFPSLDILSLALTERGFRGGLKNAECFLVTYQISHLHFPAESSSSLRDERVLSPPQSTTLNEFMELWVNFNGNLSACLIGQLLRVAVVACVGVVRVGVFDCSRGRARAALGEGAALINIGRLGAVCNLVKPELPEQSPLRTGDVLVGQVD